MSEKSEIIPVWFFVGVLFLVYGILIFASGLVEWSHPPATVLANLHAPVWWGGLLIVLGAVYCGTFRPGRKKYELFSNSKQLPRPRHFRMRVGP